MAKSGRGICDTRCQLFYKECQIKEQKLKTLWYLKNKKRLYALLEKSDQLSVKPTPAKFLDVKESPEVVRKFHRILPKNILCDYQFLICIVIKINQ